MIHSTLFFARLTNLIADDDALTKLFGVRGASGLLSCLECKNVLAADRRPPKDGYFVTVACSDPKRFDTLTDADHWDRVDKVEEAYQAWQRGETTKKRFEAKAMTMGVQYNPDSVLANRDLRQYLAPATVLTHDVQHVCFSNGIVGSELYWFTKALQAKLGIHYSSFAGVIGASWTFPKHRQAKGNDLAQMFEPARVASSEEAGKWKAQASEVLGVYSLIRHIVETTVVKCPRRAAVIQRELASFRWMCKVADIVRAFKAGKTDCTEDFSEAVRSHLAAFTKAYSFAMDEDAPVRPKHHKCLHVPKQVKRDGLLLDCWALERKNGTCKRCFEHVHNTIAFERSALSRIVCQQMRACNNGRIGDYLHMIVGELPEVAVEHGVGVVVLAKQMYWKSTPVAMGDVIAVRGIFGKVVACFTFDNSPRLLLEVFNVKEEVFPSQC
jgi:hypothetical protein